MVVTKCSRCFFFLPPSTDIREERDSWCRLVCARVSWDVVPDEPPSWCPVREGNLVDFVYDPSAGPDDEPEWWGRNE